MTLQQLSYFLTAAQQGSFSAAAEALHMAQPSLSEQLHPELGLEPPDLLGQARLGHEQALRGAGEGAVIGGREEVRQLLQRHIGATLRS